MPADETTYLERLHSIERRLFAKLSSIKAREVECNGIVWVPPGWGMDYWSKGLRFRRGSEAVRYNKLDPEGLALMIGRLGDFAEHVRAKYGLDIEPPPKPPGPGLCHWVKMTVSPGYRDDVRRSEKIRQIKEGRDTLQAKRDEATEMCRTLEAEEADLLRRGREAPSATVRKRLAGEILRLRERIGRRATIVRFIDAKLKACDISMHNTEIAELAKIGPAPSAEALVDTQVEAEVAARDMEEALDAATAVDFDVASDAAETAILREMEPERQEPDAAAEAAIVQEMEKPTPAAETTEDATEEAAAEGAPLS